MTIDKDLLEQWKLLRTESDSEKIADLAKVSRVTIQTVFRTGKASTDEIFEAMAKYYREKAEMIQSFLPAKQPA